MRIVLGERFPSDVTALEAAARAAVFQALLALPTALGRPHTHAGLGVRKIHTSGIWVARVGLGLRLVFTFADGTLTLVRAASHDEVRRFLMAL